MATDPYDDEEILDGERIVRRVNSRQHVVPDENIGGYRLSSKLFSPSSAPNEGISVDLLDWLERDGVEVGPFLTKPPFDAAVYLTVGDARELDLIVGSDPIYVGGRFDPNPYHAQIWAKGPRPNRLSQGKKNALLRLSNWLIEFPGVMIVRD